MVVPIGIEILREHCELRFVIGSVRKMHITEEKHLVLALVSDVCQLKVLPFDTRSVSAQICVELRQYAFGRHLIATWNRDEHIVPFLG